MNDFYTQILIKKGEFSINSSMIKLALITLLLLSQTLAQDSVLSESGDASAEVQTGESTNVADLPSSTSSASTSTSSPDGTKTAALYMISLPKAPANWNFLQENTLGGSSRWVYPGGSFVLKPTGYIATYTITFYTDCPQNPVILNFAATGMAYVQLNGQWLLTGAYPWPSTHQVTLQKPALVCGCNTLKIYVYNAWWPSPAALIYSLSQSTAGCYNCSNLGVTFYNKKTCQCECASEPCQCANKLQLWFNYPNCGCMCPKSLYCTGNKFFSGKSCACECLPKCCPSGYVQDSNTCECRRQIYCLRVEDCIIGYQWDGNLCKCVPKCPNAKTCLSGQALNYETCKCQCTSVARCISPLTWNPDTCKCQCPYSASCPAPWTWNRQTCKCECQIFCIATMKVDTTNCKCVPFSISSLTSTRIIDSNVLTSALSVSGGA